MWARSCSCACRCVCALGVGLHVWVWMWACVGMCGGAVVILVYKCRWIGWIRSSVWCIGVRAWVCARRSENGKLGLWVSICRHLISIYHSDKLFTCTGQQQKEGGVRSMQRLVWSNKGNSPLTLLLCDFPDLRNAKKFAEQHAFLVFR